MKTYTHSDPMPSALLKAMSSLGYVGAVVGPQDAYRDADGHHLVARKGEVVVHAVLALDHHADGVAWADDDMSWTVTRDGVPVVCERWSHVVSLVRDAADRAPLWPAAGERVTLRDVRSANGRAYTGRVVSTPADGEAYLSVDYAADEYDANVHHFRFRDGEWTWEYAPKEVTP